MPGDAALLRKRKRVQGRALTTVPLDLRGFVNRGRTIREQALNADWSALGSSANAAAHYGRGALDRLTATIEAIATIQSDSKMRDGQGAWSSLRASLEHRSRRLQFDHALHAGLTIDALLGKALASFNGRIEDGPQPTTAAEGRALARRTATYRRGRLSALHTSVKDQAWASARTRARAVLADVPEKLMPLAEMAADLYGSSSRPFTGGGTFVPEAASAACRVHTELRELLFLAAASAQLLYHAERGRITGSIPAADLPSGNLPFDSTVDEGDEVALAHLLDDPSVHAGGMVTAEGLVRAVQYKRTGRKFVTLIEVAATDASGGPAGILRCHFQDLRNDGIVPGSWVRFTGRFTASAPWSGNKPAVDLQRPNLDGSRSWIDRMRVVIRPIFDAYPRGLLLQWSLTPHKRPAASQQSKPQPIDELTHRQLFRISS